MNEVDRKQAFANYVRAVADEMMLKDWDGDILFADEVEHEDSEQDRDDYSHGAQILCTPHRKHFELTVENDILKGDPDDVRQTVTHELIHCHFAAMWDQVRIDLLKRLSQEGYDLFVSSFERNMEWGVDAMADAAAPHMPAWSAKRWKSRDGKKRKEVVVEKPRSRRS